MYCCTAVSNASNKIARRGGAPPPRAAAGAAEARYSFSQEDERLLEACGHHIGIMLQNAQLYDEARGFEVRKAALTASIKDSLAV